MSQPLHTFNDVQLDAIEYKAPVKNAKGGTVVYMSTVPGSSDPKDKLKFQLSENDKSTLPVAVWGLSTPMAGTESNRRTLDVTVDDPALLKFLREFDEKNITTAVENCEKWFKKSMDRSTIENMYVPVLKNPYKEGASYTTRVKVTIGDKYATNVLVAAGTGNQLEYHAGDQHDLTKNSKMMIRVECSGLWFMSKQFGCSLNATDILVWPNKSSLSGINGFVFAKDTVLVEKEPEPMSIDAGDF